MPRRHLAGSQFVPKEPSFDPAEAHRWFSTRCFNRAWERIDRPQRTDDENEEMIRLAHASLWHWTERADCRDRHIATGYWQLSRVYALVGEVQNARKYGRLSLDNAPPDEPFFVGYAYEALARAELLAGNRDEAERYVAQAHRQAELIADSEAKQLLIDDLRSLG